MEMKIVPLNVRRPLTREELRIRRAKTISLAAGALLGVVTAAILCAVCVGMATAATEAPTEAETSLAMELPLAEPTAEHTHGFSEKAHVWDVPLTHEELKALLEACEAGRIAPELALGLIQVESSFRADAVNLRTGCYGYCQLNPRYFPSGLSPAENIRTGIEYLAYQLERYDNLEAALTAYNAGHDTGSRTYANMVLEAAATFER